MFLVRKLDAKIKLDARTKLAVCEVLRSANMDSRTSKASGAQLAAEDSGASEASRAHLAADQ